MVKEMRRLAAGVLSGALLLGTCAGGEWFRPDAVRAAVTSGIVMTVNDAAAGEDASATGSAVSVEPGQGGDTIQPAQMGIDVTSVNMMAGKSFKLTLANIPAGEISGGNQVSFSSEDESVAVITDSKYNTDFTQASATIKLLMSGQSVIHVKALGQDMTCDVNVVNAMSKDDFGMYNVENFINYCNKHGSWKWAWTGEWGTPKGKYGSTFRGIKIGSDLSDVIAAYGDVKLVKCKKATSGKKGDPFLYEKKFNTSTGQLKVNRCADLKYGKYKIRFYFTPKDKVFGFIMTMGFKLMTKELLRKNSGLSMV
ncbi:MAG: hypothetical protein J6P16_06040 [Eubacterium sp.]|nr:hypothetical protein [Eubacterium sp.]